MQAIDGINAAREKHTKRHHAGAAGLPPTTMSNINIVQQDGAEVLSKFPQLRSALALYARGSSPRGDLGLDLNLAGSSAAISSISTMRFLTSNGSKTEARLPQLRSALALCAQPVKTRLGRGRRAAASPAQPRQPSASQA